jgi:hypothetical protein
MAANQLLLGFPRRSKAVLFRRQELPVPGRKPVAIQLQQAAS